MNLQCMRRAYQENSWVAVKVPLNALHSDLCIFLSPKLK